MRRSRKSDWRITGPILAGAAVLGVVVAGRAVAAVRKRRRQLRQGEIRPLWSLWTTVRGLRIHARASTAATGRNVPVVLVHGFGISSSYFVPAAELLATEFEVYAPDLPGHGLSDTPPEPLDVPRLAGALLDWMDAIGLRRASLVGNSMGCQVAVEAAVRSSDRVDRLVLIGPTLDPSGRPLWKLLTRFAIGGFYERKSITLLLLIDYARMALRTVAELRFMRGDRIETKLPRVTCPTLLVRGEKDFIAPMRWLEEAARLVGTRRIAVIPDWGHAVHFSSAGQLVEAIRPFLREQLAPRWS